MIIIHNLIVIVDKKGAEQIRLLFELCELLLYFKKGEHCKVQTLYYKV